MSLYLVTGRSAYRGHTPGEAFEASIPSDAEARAIARGDIELLERSNPTLRPGSWTLPAGWTTSNQTIQED